MDVQIIGYARSEIPLNEFRDRVTEKIKLKSDSDKVLLDQFKQRLHYLHGGYDDPAGFVRLKATILSLESEMKKSSHSCVRLFYFALPPAMFYPVAKTLKDVAYDPNITSRMIIEKPFGRDLESSNDLSAKLGSLFREDEVR